MTSSDITIAYSTLVSGLLCVSGTPHTKDDPETTVYER